MSGIPPPSIPDSKPEGTTRIHEIRKDFVLLGKLLGKFESSEVVRGVRAIPFLSFLTTSPCLSFLGPSKSRICSLYTSTC